jgi:hypothetical protein
MIWLRVWRTEGDIVDEPFLAPRIGKAHAVVCLLDLGHTEGKALELTLHARQSAKEERKSCQT